MRTRSISIKVIATIIVLGSVMLPFASQGRADERNHRLSFHWSGLLGIAAGEAASLNFTNGDRRAAEVEMMFLDADGGVLKSSRARVASGRSAALILPYSELSDRTGRAHVRALVRLIAPAESDRGIAALEVFDEATGRTSFGLLLLAVRGFDPQPDPPSPGQ